MKKYKFVCFLLLLLVACVSYTVRAKEAVHVQQPQDYQNKQFDMADKMRQDGKIWVVVGTIVIVVSGFFLYLFFSERKISRLEKQLKNRED